MKRKSTMKNFKKITCILMCVMLVLAVCSCSVNQEKLDAKAVAKVGEKTVFKKDLDRITALNLMYYYASNGQQIAVDDEYADQIREQLVDELVNAKLILYTAKDYGYKMNWKKVNRTASSMVKTIQKSSYIKKDGYKKVLNYYGFKNDKDLKAAAKLYAQNSVYQADFRSAFLKKIQGKKYATNTYMTVGDTKIPASYYYYCLIQKTMEQTYQDYQKQYTQQQTDEEEKTDEEKREEVKKAAEEMIKEKASFYQAGKEGKIKVKDGEVKSQRQSNSSLDAMFGDLSDIYRTYGITSKQYGEAANWVAKADVYRNKLNDKVEYKKADENDAKSEFNKNKKNYDSSTVSAKHILTSDKSVAEEIYKAAKADGVKFDSIMAKYQADPTVSEASDLGPFTYSTMVEEFSKAAFAANKGDVVGPVKTEYGYHVIYVYDKNTKEPSFDSYKSSIMASINAERKQEAAEKQDEEIKKKYTMTVKINNIDAPYEMLMEKLKSEHPVKINKSVMNKTVSE